MPSIELSVIHFQRLTGKKVTLALAVHDRLHCTGYKWTQQTIISAQFNLA